MAGPSLNDELSYDYSLNDPHIPLDIDDRGLVRNRYVWLNVYDGGFVLQHNSKEACDRAATEHRIARLKIRIEPGRFDH